MAEMIKEVIYCDACKKENKGEKYYTYKDVCFNCAGYLSEKNKSMDWKTEIKRAIGISFFIGSVIGAVIGFILGVLA